MVLLLVKLLDIFSMMKKVTSFLGLLLLVAVFIFSGINTVSAQSSYAEQIDNYQVDIKLDQSGEIYIQERIEYDFGIAQRHGIFRNIPYKYKNDFGKFNLRLNDIAVTMDGQPVGAAISSSNGEKNIKIGDADITITGKHVYNISYSVKRAINFFPDHDELYWNAIGTDWTVPILKSSVTISAPAQVTKYECFVGEENSQSTECNKSGLNTAQPTFDYPQVLQPGEGITVVVGIPAGSVSKPTTQQRILDIARDNGIVALPIIVFVVMFLLWRKFGKDDKGRGTIVPQYDPPKDLTPLYMGTLVDGKLDNRDFAAELIYLATQGYLKIDRIETKKLLWFKGSDYQFAKLRDIDPTLPTQTQALFSAIFSDMKTLEEISKSFKFFRAPKLLLNLDKVITEVGSKKDVVTLSELKNSTVFSGFARAASSIVFKSLKSEGYYKYNPQTALALTIAAGMFLSFLIGIFAVTFFGALGVASAVVSGLIMIVFGLLMPARTKKGAEMKEYILGLKDYMNVAEKDRLEFHNAPEKNPERFELLLPFAVALGVEKQWAKQFEGIYNTQPSWYHDSTGAGFNAVLLSNSISDFSSSMQSAVSSVTTASSGGSGFSGGGVGGGGGGGGGGSW